MTISGRARLQHLAQPAEPGDAELVARAVTGDRWAQEALYRRHVQRATMVAARLLRHGADVEDVVQDVFVRAFHELRTLREPASFGSWVIASVVHRAHKRFRRRRIERMLGLGAPRDEALASQAADGASPELRAELALLDRALDRLGDDDRVAWTLHHLLGYRVPELAELTRCSLATANRRLARARAIVDRHVRGAVAPEVER